MSLIGCNGNVFRDSDSPSGFLNSPCAGTITAPNKLLPCATAIFAATFLVTCITASIVTPIENSDATSSVSVETAASAYYVNISSATNGAAGVVSGTVQATPGGTLGVIEDRLKVTSNTPNGYSVYVSMANNDANGQKLVNTTTSSYYFSPIDPETYSLDNPGTLSQANTWGVAVSGARNSLFSNASEYSDDGVSQATKFAPVPVRGAEQLLFRRTGSTIQSGGTVDQVSVYYGFHATAGLPTGTYRNTVLYTAYAEGGDTGGSASVFAGDVNYKTGGTATFTTSLYTDRDVSAEDATVTITDGTTTKECVVTSVTKSSSDNSSVMIACTAPVWSKPGDYTANITIERFGHESSATISYDTDGITIDSNAQIKTMQGMTSTACSQWETTPSAFSSGSKPVYNYGSDLSITEFSNNNQAERAWADVMATALATSGSAISNINADVPETYLRDNRDNSWYRIRKLADGSCWMTENLRLVFVEDGSSETGVVGSDGRTISASGNSITSANTNITDDAALTFATIVTATETATAADVNSAESNDSSVTYARTYYGGDIKTGTYYNWKAATAGTGGDGKVNPTGSICPKGWQLPAYSSSSKKSWYNLVLNTYGYDSRSRTSTVPYGDASSEGSYYGTIKGAHIYAMNQTMRRDPIGLLYSGQMEEDQNALSGVGTAASLWLNTASETAEKTV